MIDKKPRPEPPEDSEREAPAAPEGAASGALVEPPEGALGRVEGELAELKDKYLRLAAEYDNFRKRSTKERTDLWPTVALPARLDADLLSRDAAVNRAYAEDAGVHRVTTPGAWREIQWARRAVAADGARIESPLLFLLGGEDRVVDAHLARAFADRLQGPVQVRWYPEAYHEVLHDPLRDQALADVLAFLSQHV